MKKRITYYRREGSSVWIAFPNTTAASALRFQLLGAWRYLRFSDGSTLDRKGGLIT